MRAPPLVVVPVLYPRPKENDRVVPVFLLDLLTG